jgi:hypothetical protein
MGRNLADSVVDLIKGAGKNLHPTRGPHTHLGTKTLRPGRHAVPDITRQVAEWAHRRGSQLSDRQQTALANYRRESIFSISNAGNYSEKELFRAYFEFFDDMFFGGFLEGCITIKLLRDPVFTSWEGERPRYGHDAGEGGITVRDQNTSAFEIRKHRVGFTIRIREPNHLESTRERCLWQLNVLLHEMVHCIFLVFSCVNRGCKEEMKRFSSLGPTGHGACWQDAAYAVEKAVQDPAFINLGIHQWQVSGRSWEVGVHKERHRISEW